MQNEKYFYDYCNEFEYNHVYEKLEYKYMYMCEIIYIFMKKIKIIFFQKR